MQAGDVVNTGYMKAIDVWMFICMLFVLFAFLELPLVHFLKPRGQRTPTEDEDGKMEIQCETNKKSKIGSKLDFVSKILFPGLFLLFNIIYWSIYN